MPSKLKSAIRTIQERLGCSYTEALKKLRALDGQGLGIEDALAKILDEKPPRVVQLDPATLVVKVVDVDHTAGEQPIVVECPKKQHFATAEDVERLRRQGLIER